MAIRESDRASVAASASIALDSPAIGIEFELSTLRIALEHGQKEVLDLLDEVVRDGFFIRVSDSPGRFRFAHALIRGAVYDAMGLAARLQIHGQIARALEKIYGANINSHCAESRITTARPTTRRRLLNTDPCRGCGGCSRCESRNGFALGVYVGIDREDRRQRGT